MGTDIFICSLSVVWCFVTGNTCRIVQLRQESYVLPTRHSKGCGVIRSSQDGRNIHHHTPVEGIVMHVGTLLPLWALWSRGRKNRHGTTVSAVRVSLCVITSPWSRLFSHRGHMRDGKKKWHNFLHFSTSVPHLTSIQTDLVRFSAPAVEIVNRQFSLCC